MGTNNQFTALSKGLRVVCRHSPLSLLQVKEVFASLPSVSYELLPLASFGDKNKDISLMDNIAGDFFTRELDDSLLNETADVAIHSAKDLPYPLPAGLELYCLTEAADQSDALVSRNKLTLAQLPAGARVGTSSKTRKAELLKLRPDLEIISIRGTIEERIAQVDEGLIDALIVATCALERLGLSRRIAEILPFATHPLQGHLAVVGKRVISGIKSLFQTFDIRQRYGKVTLAGFGPGNPDLLTIGADKAMKEADIIFHDDLLDQDYLNRYPAEKVYVGKRKDRHSFHQDEINDLLYRAAIAGKRVVRLKGGDPMIFAHGREEIDFLQSRLVEVEVIPGISAGIALAAYTHIPLTHRGLASSVAFITGHAESAQLPDADTLVYYMAGANISGIAKRLIAAGRDASTPVALVHNVSLPGQKTFYSHLGELQYSTFKYPTPVVIVIGQVVAFEHTGARGQEVLVTGTSASDYTGLGKVIHTPLIRVEKSRDNEVGRLLRERIESLQWIVFTSRYGVRFFFELLHDLHYDLRSLSRTSIASVGKTTTAELGKLGLYPDIESPTESAEGLVAYFQRTGISGQHILLPRSDKGLKYLSDQLRSLGNEVTDLPVYHNVPNREVQKVDLKSIAKILFSSPSGVEAFREVYGELPANIQLVAKGKTTENNIQLALHETLQAI